MSRVLRLRRATEKAQRPRLEKKGGGRARVAFVLQNLLEVKTGCDLLEGPGREG